jgi:hypothetical protein
MVVQPPPVLMTPAIAPFNQLARPIGASSSSESSDSDDDGYNDQTSSSKPFTKVLPAAKPTGQDITSMWNSHQK